MVALASASPARPGRFWGGGRGQGWLSKTTWRFPSCTSTTTGLALASRLASAPRPPLHGGLAPLGGGELDGSAGFDSESHSNRATWRSTKSTQRSTTGLWDGPPVRSTIAKKPVRGGLSLQWGPTIKKAGIRSSRLNFLAFPGALGRRAGLNFLKNRFGAARRPDVSAPKFRAPRPFPTAGRRPDTCGGPGTRQGCRGCESRA